MQNSGVPTQDFEKIIQSLKGIEPVVGAQVEWASLSQWEHKPGSCVWKNMCSLLSVCWFDT